MRAMGGLKQKVSKRWWWGRGKYERIHHWKEPWRSSYPISSFSTIWLPNGIKIWTSPVTTCQDKLFSLKERLVESFYYVQLKSASHSFYSLVALGNSMLSKNLFPCHLKAFPLSLNMRNSVTIPCVTWFLDPLHLPNHPIDNFLRAGSNINIIPYGL